MNEDRNTPAVVAAAPSASQRFTDVIMREFTDSTGMTKLTPHQKNLIQGYFIGCDNALRTAEAKRQKDADGKGDWAQKAAATTPYTWNNVNIDGKLAQRVVVYAKLGLDMTLPNHLFPIPYMNGKNGKYDLNFQEGYRGKEIKTKKYSFYTIKNMRYELVYSNDEFKVGKKDAFHTQDTYEFNIKNPFDRGELVGGFAYIEFDDPQRNILLIMSKADIEKRHAVAKSQDFWKKWYDEMALKTVVSAACGKVTLDPEKIDPDFRIMQQAESDAAEAELAEEIRQNANRQTINVTPVEPEPAFIPERTQAMQQTAPKVVVPEPVPQPVAEMAEQPSLLGAEIPPEEVVEF